MKKTVKMPDGTEEVVEGTPEEIAEYEKQLKEGKQPPPPQKPVLYGSPAAVDGLELTAAELLLIRSNRLGIQPYYTTLRQWPGRLAREAAHGYHVLNPVLYKLTA